MQSNALFPADYPVHETGIHVSGIFLLKIIIIRVLAVQGYFMGRYMIHAADFDFLMIARLKKLRILKRNSKRLVFSAALCDHNAVRFAETCIACFQGFYEISFIITEITVHFINASRMGSLAKIQAPKFLSSKAQANSFSCQTDH